MNDFVKHFQNLSNTPHFSSFTNDDDSVNSDSIVDVEQLDCHFTYYEVIKTICNMNKHKSANIDGNVIDFFIDAKEFITPYLITMFNYIFEKGIYP